MLDNITLPENKTGIVEYPDGAIEILPILQGLILGLSGIGIRTITEKNIGAILARLQLYEFAIDNKIFVRPDGTGIEEEDLKEWIGLTVHHAKNISIPSFLRGIWSLHSRKF